QLFNRLAWFKVLTIFALPTTGVVASSTVLNLVGWRDPAHLVIGTALMLLVYFLADTVPLTLLLASLDGRPFQVAYVSNYAGVVLALVGIEFFGRIFYIVWAASPWVSV